MARVTPSSCGCKMGPDDDSFLTVETDASAQFTVQGSEFIGSVEPVETVAAAERFCDRMCVQYSDATHNVPAYRVHADDTGQFLREYQNDDGEPSGSAGKPIMNVLDGQSLENVAVVVTRYYGGTKLGVGGLVRAYSQATTMAIEAAGVTERVPHAHRSITVDYDDSGVVRTVLESEGVAFDADYDERVTFSIRVPTDELASVADRLQSATSGRATLERSQSDDCRTDR
ncbi:IMPACT family protein [Halocatena halophila]|uniref:IMPACT family protein n=1 Tax=Halocatena halophila TaxID=2814576 RepID=UPI0038B36A10